jgi:hypothetical protein
MTRRVQLVALGLAAALSGCKAPPAPLVPIIAPTHEGAVLAGIGRAKHDSPHTGRRHNRHHRHRHGDSAAGSS